MGWEVYTNCTYTGNNIIGVNNLHTSMHLVTPHPHDQEAAQSRVM